MTSHVLGIGYTQNSESIAKIGIWKQLGLELDCTDDFDHAACMLSNREYTCVAICMNAISEKQLESLRKAQSIPIIVTSPDMMCDRAHCVRILKEDPPDAQSVSDEQNDFTTKHERETTVIKVKNLQICLEQRSVSIDGSAVELTEKEFDILALLLLNQKQVFTHEMMMDAIWHNDAAFYSRNALSSHISNLKKKLKHFSDVADQIKSIRGIGYKFEP